MKRCRRSRQSIVSSPMCASSADGHATACVQSTVATTFESLERAALCHPRYRPSSVCDYRTA